MKRAGLAKLSNLLDALEKDKREKRASNYTWRRDADANLIITYLDGYEAKLPFIPFRPYQIELQKKMFVEGIKRVLVERPRRSGKEVESWNLTIQAAITDPGLYMMIYPTNVRARAVLWEGAILLPDGRSVKFLDMIPKRLLSSANNQEMKVKLINGSIIWIVGSDIDPDKLRGTNARGAVFAEFAFQDPRVFYILLPVFRQNGGWLIGQSTYDGMNHFYQMIQNNKDNPLWYCREDSIETLVDEEGKRFITDEMIQEDIDAGMPSYLVQQEYYGIVQVNQETKYFAHGINHIFENNHIIQNLYLPNQNLYTAWDLGVNDMNCITFFQIENRNGTLWPYVIGYVENNNKDLLFYVNECRQFAARYHLVIKTHFLPHDGAAQKVLSIGNETTASQMQKLGEAVRIVPRPAEKRVAIEQMRRKLHMTYFNKENTQRLIDCLSNYSKEYDPKLNTYKNKPTHDWASHGCFTGDTLILTPSGQVPIMHLPKIGKVLTTCGWKPYINPRITRRNAPLVEVMFKNGYTVKCTPDHLFLTVKGWISAEFLQPNTMIQSYSIPSPNILTEDSIEYGHRTNISLEEEKNYIGWLGQLLLVKYRRTATSIIEMVTKSIIHFITLNVWMLVNILGLHGKKQSIQGQIDLLQQTIKKRKNGIDHPKVDYGIAEMQLEPKAGQNGNALSRLVSFVEEKLKCYCELEKIHKNIAHRNADLCIDRVTKIKNLEDVWCLTVPDISEFSLANGAIVHNCDSYQTMTLALDANLVMDRPMEIVYYNSN